MTAARPLSVVPLQCRWCNHGWHGLACTSTAACRCESSLLARDDSWRPHVSGTYEDRAKQLMDETGVDGWVAMLVVGHKIIPGGCNPLRIRAALYGRTA